MNIVEKDGQVFYCYVCPSCQEFVCKKAELDNEGTCDIAETWCSYCDACFHVRIAIPDTALPCDTSVFCYHLEPEVVC